MVLAEVRNSAELVLEALPDVVGFKSCRLLLHQQDCLAQLVVVFFRVFVKCSHLSASDIAIFGAASDHNFEQTFSLVIVDKWVIGKLNVSVNVRPSRRVQVMQSTLWHLVKHIVELRFLNSFFVFVEVLNNHVVQWRCELIFQLRKLCVCSFFRISQVLSDFV